MTFQQGQVWRVDIPGDPKRGRPMIVISRDEMNRGHEVLVIPTYTTQLSQKRSKSSYVFLPRGAANLPEDCVAQTAHIQMVGSSDLRDRIGVLDSRYMGEIIHALGWVIEAECRPV